jgi:hypothetical protein
MTIAPLHDTTKAPPWARGTYIWKMNLADRPGALGEARAAIAEVAHRLDHAVEHVVCLTGVIGTDEGFLPWDGCWPYWQRLSYRVNGWDEVCRFMIDMREQHRAWITFHVNLTDVNAGLRLYPETRAFFERLREARAIYSRPAGKNAQPWFGLPFVPEALPADIDPSEIIALVDYRRFWESGLAREQIDGLLDRLPYVPPLLFLDVLGPVGWCHHPGFPDGDLGGSRASQLAGVQAIVAYLRSRGCDVAGESPDRLMEHAAPPIRYSWSHGGLSSNDYRQIGAGFGMGACARRGGKAMHVYGNQGGYHLQCGERVPKLISTGWDPMRAEGGGKRWDDLARSPIEDGIREWGRAEDLARQFHLTVASELHHIGVEAVRLPGSGWDRLDAAEGRARIDALTLRGADRSARPFAAADGALLGTARLVGDTWASGGKAVEGLDDALGNGVEFVIDTPVAGPRTAYLRYASAGGATVSLQVGDGPRRLLTLADTAAWHHYGDHPVELDLPAGTSRIRVQRARAFAEWSDGSRAEWTLDGGFRAWRGDVVLGVGGDRFCPDTWSGQRRVLLFSEQGGERTWILPPGWAGVTRVRLIPLGATGRDLSRARVLPVASRACTVPLEALQGAVLLPEG